MSHSDELSLFLNEVADVRPIRSDNIHPQGVKSAPTEAQLARRQAATAEQLALDHLLKSYVSAWLPQLPAVMAIHSAERRHGGSGALYVLLRKSERKKAENRERHQKRLG